MIKHIYHRESNKKIIFALCFQPQPNHLNSHTKQTSQPTHQRDCCLFQDYDQFDMANEIDEIEKFLKLAPDDATVTSNAEVHLGNGDVPIENSKPVEDVQNGDASEAVVGSTTDEDQQPVENGTHENNEVGVFEDGVDSSNAD